MPGTENIIILHGDDEQAINEKVKTITAEQKSSGMGDLNFSAIDGKTTMSEDFANAVYALPFMMDQRVVILTNPLALAGGRTGNEKFIHTLDSIPASTLIYLIIPDSFERKDWVILGKTSFLRKYAEKNQERVKLVEMKQPSLNMMREWIMKKTVAMNGKIEPAAAQALVAAVGNDTRMAVNELEKLLLYVNYERVIDITDVEDLVTGTTSGSVFEMVDSIVSGQAAKALRTLHRLMEDEEIPMLFAMIVRQFRLLIQVREIVDEGGRSENVQRELGQISFVADKLVHQASVFSKAELDEIYHELLKMDYQFKTSQSDPNAAMDILVMDIAERLNK